MSSSWLVLVLVVGDLAVLVWDLAMDGAGGLVVVLVLDRLLFNELVLLYTGN